MAKALKWKIYHFLVCFFCASVDVGRFLKTRFRPWIHQPSESFGLTLATETTFNSNFCSKTARYRLFLAVVRCCVTTTLAAETFGLLNVYLNYKFGLGLPSFYLFFSLFENDINIVTDKCLNFHFYFPDVTWIKNAIFQLSNAQFMKCTFVCPVPNL